MEASFSKAVFAATSSQQVVRFAVVVFRLLNFSRLEAT